MQTVLKIAAYERSLESQVKFDVQGRPIYRVADVAARAFRLDGCRPPGEFQYGGDRGGPALLTIYLAAGQEGEVPVLVRGKLGREGALEKFPASSLPRLEVLDVDRQQGDMAVQVDPAFDVDAVGLKHCEPMHQSGLRLAEPATAAGHSAGAAVIARATTPARCGFRPASRRDVRHDHQRPRHRSGDRRDDPAGFCHPQRGHPAAFVPAARHDEECRLAAKMLRQKTIAAEADGQIRVTLEFQEEVMDQWRVSVENDRLLEQDKPYAVPIPVIERLADAAEWRTGRQYVTLQSRRPRRGGRRSAGRAGSSLAATERLGTVEGQAGRRQHHPS